MIMEPNFSTNINAQTGERSRFRKSGAATSYLQLWIWVPRDPSHALFSASSGPMKLLFLFHLSPSYYHLLLFWVIILKWELCWGAVPKSLLHMLILWEGIQGANWTQGFPKALLSQSCDALPVFCWFPESSIFGASWWNPYSSSG